ncbi:uncharacterized protein [Nicotiana tomentosiformis]|uniref:uncharacterized protein n=1 Tax=Nicotiana tomentosiformis TaxID=4098 RepID=UPI00388CDD53
MIDKDSQVKLSPSKLDILAFAIDVSLLDIVEPLRETIYPRIYVVEKLIVAQPVSEEVVAEHSMYEETNKEGEVEREKAHNSEEKKSEDEVASEREKGEQEGDLKEGKGTEGGEDFESDENDHEGVGNDEKDNEVEDSEFESEEEHESEDSEGSMTIGNTVMPHLEDSKIKVVDAQLIKEARSNKRTRISVIVAETVVELDEDEEHVSSLKGTKSSVKRVAVKPIKVAASTSQKKIRGKNKIVESEFDAEELGLLLNIPSLGFDNYLKKKWPTIDNDVDKGIIITKRFPQISEMDAPSKGV